MTTLRDNVSNTGTGWRETCDALERTLKESNAVALGATPVRDWQERLSASIAAEGLARTKHQDALREYRDHRDDTQATLTSRLAFAQFVLAAAVGLVALLAYLRPSNIDTARCGDTTGSQEVVEQNPPSPPG